MNTIVSINDSLMHAPVGVLVMLFAVALGYLLKISNFFPNKFIPLVVVFCTTILFPLMQACFWIGKLMEKSDPNMKTQIWIHVPQNIVIGFILGFVAWALHAQILRRFLDPKLFNDDGSTKFFVKPPTNPNP